jgi:NADPH:quinone reductase-like Zn-dependent oxidoreductase
MKTIKMNAAINTRFGSPEHLKIIQVPIPEPKEDELLVKVKASSVTKADTMMRRGIPKFSRLFIGVRKPKIKEMGTGFSGIVHKLGKNVTRYKIGDEVFGETGMAFGANAEFLIIKSSGVVMPKPGFLSFSDAATITDGFLTSFNFLQEMGKIKKGDQVLIIGASGSLGTAAIQIAKHYGAIVTGVSSGKNEKLVRRLGAEYHIDYTKIQYNNNNNNNKVKYDIIFDTVGVSSFSKSSNILSRKGIYLSPVLNLRLLFDMLLTSFSSERNAKFSATGLLDSNKLKKMLTIILEIMEASKMKVVIDKKYSLKEIQEAHSYVDTSRKVGNIILVA